MILFYKKSPNHYIAVGTAKAPLDKDKLILKWLFSDAELIESQSVPGEFIGPRKEMITPWSTNAVEITENCGVKGIERIEEYLLKEAGDSFDPMVQQHYHNLDQGLFTLEHQPEPIRSIADISTYNEEMGLALSEEEIEFLEQVAHELGRSLTDSEVFGFSQINSEHCRHKIFNGSFIIDDEVQQLSLFQWIKKTSKENPNFIVSAYKDNVAFIQGPEIEQFAPITQDKPDFFETTDFESVISLKAETHNFPTTVEPFNGAATGSGGEIRDRLAGGQGSFPLSGTAVYMTSYPRTEGSRPWESREERKWLYQSPKEILIKASNGASDFGNKYGQPLTCGSLLTFEYEDDNLALGFDKVIMLAGGIGFAKLKNAKKQRVEKDQDVIVLGGDNYRIGMGGGAVSSVNTGEFGNTLELNAVQRSNPEMQKRVANAIRALAEMKENPVVSIHDHGAGGHLNCLSELVEESGGTFDLNEFPVGDPTLSEKEILSNESQERMGLVLKPEDTAYLKSVSDRERAPMYKVGKTTGNLHLDFKGSDQQKPFDLELRHLFGSSPQTILNDKESNYEFEPLAYSFEKIEDYVKKVS
jgi:phosphoribosylformylglycinamidine synthase